MIRHIIESMVERKEEELARATVFLDAETDPDEFTRINELSDEIEKSANILAKRYEKISAESIQTVCQDIADEMNRGNIEKHNFDAFLMDQNEYMDIFITRQMDEHAEKTFRSLFTWLSEQERGAWLQANYINHESDEWTDQHSTFVIRITN